MPWPRKLALVALLACCTSSVTAIHVRQRGYESATIGAAELQLVGQAQTGQLEQKALSQETIDAAAQQATEEAVAEAQAAEQRMSTESALDEASLSSSVSMLHALETQQESAEASSLSGLLDQSMLDGGSAVDTTLEEIKKLRIIDQELAKSQAQPANPNAINEQAIEASTLKKLNGDKDASRIQTLVQQEVSDAADKIDSQNLLSLSLDTLEYGANIDNKEFLQDDVILEEPKQAPKPIVKAVPKEVQDPAVEASEAALGHVSIKKAESKVSVPEKPLQPSADATSDDLDATFSYKPKAHPKILKKRSPQQERQMLDKLIQKSVDLGKKKAQKHPQHKLVKHTAPKHEEAMALLSAKSKLAHKAHAHAHVQKEKKVKNHRKHHHHGRKEQELLQENSQLDNLFVTMRDSLVDKKVPQKPPHASFLQINGRLRSKDDDIDDQVDASLKSMAHSMTQQAVKDHARPAKVQLVSDNKDTMLGGLLKEAEVEQSVKKVEEPSACDTKNQDEMSTKSAFSLFKQASDDLEDEKPAQPKKEEDLVAGSRLSSRSGDQAALKLLGEVDMDDKVTEKKSEGPPEEDDFLQLGAQVQATMQARVQASAQAEAASQALAKMGVKQKAHVQAQDQNLIDTLKSTINQLEIKKNPALAVADAKKNAVNNIQKALTKKILNRLDDSAPLVNVFSKMQSLSKMMPAIQDFERRLGILHQVEPILESAIGTLSHVVDLSKPVPAMPNAAPVVPPPAPTPPPAPAAPAGPNLDQLKSLLAQAEGAQAQQAAAAAPAPAEPADDDAGAGGLDLSALLGGAATAPPAAPAAPTGLEALLGAAGAGPAAPEFQTPSFLSAPTAAPAPEPENNASAEQALISKLLGSAM